MSRLLETIKIADGRICNIAYHNRRLNRSRAAHYTVADPIDLRDHITVPLDKPNGVYKCRVLYQSDIQQIEYHEYQIKAIKSLQLVKANTIEYSHKYEDRSALLDLYQSKGQADDILIIKRGLVTDSYYCNVAFRTLDDQWITPTTPLLQGTKRQQLLDEGILSTDDIRLNDLDDYTAICLFNSMIEFGEIELPIDAINTDPS